jgi:alkylation response protein AidB-like acyl-CoA dehydrogenase
VNLLTTSEQDGIIEAASSFLADRMSIGETRRLFEAGVVPAVSDDTWSAAADLGWFALALPAEHDGIGGGLADEALLFREIGRAGASGPFLSTVLGARVAAFGGAQALAAEIASGRRVGLIIPDAVDSIAADASVIGDVQLLDADPDGLALTVTPELGALVEVARLGELTEVECVDPTARLLRATGRSAAPIVSVSAVVDAIELRGHVLAAAMLTGIAEWARDTGAQHARDRIQFDRPIGVNQAVKHPCAEMAVQAELAYAQSIFAALAIDEGRPDAEFHALSAHTIAASAAEYATGATLQILGGMGFTHEHDVHLYLKRGELLARVLGLPGMWLDRLLRLPAPV